MIRVFVPHVRRLLAELKQPLIFVDVGSRNGVLELGEIAEFVSAYGFEPNQEEYEKLANGETDLARLYGVRSPQYRQLTYSPYGLYSYCGQHDFYVTRGPGACGLHEPNFDRLREIKWKGRRFKRNFADDIFEVVKIVPVEVRTLEWFGKEQALDHIDYLKIDVEGAEYEVLAGAADLLKRVSLIKVEVCFIPFRKGQKLFSDVDLLLREYGFDLLRYEIDPMQIGYKEREYAFGVGLKLGHPDRYGQPLSADAIYINRNLNERERLIAQSAILIDRNYLDEALFVLKSRAQIEDPELLELLRTYRGQTVTRVLAQAIGFMRWLRGRFPL